MGRQRGWRLINADRPPAESVVTRMDAQRAGDRGTATGDDADAESRSDPEPLSPRRCYADCTTAMGGYDFREEQHLPYQP
jgi:hypothetical protein